jgi:hypothetical protein
MQDTSRSFVLLRMTVFEGFGKETYPMVMLSTNHFRVILSNAKDLMFRSVLHYRLIAGLGAFLSIANPQPVAHTGTLRVTYACRC